MDADFNDPYGDYQPSLLSLQVMKFVTMSPPRSTALKLWRMSVKLKLSQLFRLAHNPWPGPKYHARELRSRHLKKKQLLPRVTCHKVKTVMKMTHREKKLIWWFQQQKQNVKVIRAGASPIYHQIPDHCQRTRNQWEWGMQIPQEQRKLWSL